MELSMSLEKFLTPAEVAAEFGDFFTEPRLRQWRHRGGGPVYRKLGRRCVYRRSDIEAWLDANLRVSTSDAPTGER